MSGEQVINLPPGMRAILDYFTEHGTNSDVSPGVPLFTLEPAFAGSRKYGTRWISADDVYSSAPDIVYGFRSEAPFRVTLVGPMLSSRFEFVSSPGDDGHAVSLFEGGGFPKAAMPYHSLFIDGEGAAAAEAEAEFVVPSGERERLITCQNDDHRISLRYAGAIYMVSVAHSPPVIQEDVSAEEEG